MIHLQASEHQGLATRSQEMGLEQILPWEGNSPASTLILIFRTVV